MKTGAFYCCMSISAQLAKSLMDIKPVTIAKMATYPSQKRLHASHQDHCADMYVLHSSACPCITATLISGWSSAGSASCLSIPAACALIVAVMVAQYWSDLRKPMTCSRGGQWSIIACRQGIHCDMLRCKHLISHTCVKVRAHTLHPRAPWLSLLHM